MTDPLHINANDFAIPPVPAELREEVLITYEHDGTITPSGGKDYPSDLYKYVHQMARGGVGGRPVPGVSIEERGCAAEGGIYLLVLLPFPLRAVNLTTGTSSLVLGALLHELEIVHEGKPVLSVDGYLADNHPDAMNTWRNFVEDDAKLDEQE
jgi:hypothetical protein